MRTVLQGKDEYGCGAACLAMLAGIPYERARREIFGERTPGKAGVIKQKLLECLKQHGLRAKRSGRFSDALRVNDLQSDALLGGYLLQDDDYKHWLVWDASERVVRDPYGFRAPFRLTSYTTFNRR